MRLCWEYKPEEDGGFDKDFLENGVYKCTDSLLDITRGTSRCIPISACTEIINGAMCITNSQCVTLYGAVYFDGDSRSCVGTKGC